MCPFEFAQSEAPKDIHMYISVVYAQAVRANPTSGTTNTFVPRLQYRDALLERINVETEGIMTLNSFQFNRTRIEFQIPKQGKGQSTGKSATDDMYVLGVAPQWNIEPGPIDYPR